MMQFLTGPDDSQHAIDDWLQGEQSLSPLPFHSRPMFEEQFRDPGGVPLSEGKAKKLFWSMIEQVTDANPRWFSVTLAEVMLSAFQVLKGVLSNPGRSDASWSHPFIKVDFPMPWNWEEWNSREKGYGAHFVTFSKDDFASQTAFSNRLIELWDSYRAYDTLRTITLNAFYTKDETGLRRALPRELLDSMTGNRDSAVRYFFEPLAFQMDASGIPARSKELFLDIETRLSFFRPPTAIECNGTRCGWRFTFYPLIVDSVRQTAFFPMVPELLFPPGTDNHWDTAQIERFWHEFFNAVEDAIRATWFDPVVLPEWCNVFDGLSDADIDEIVAIADKGTELDSSA